ncbi:MAG: efflux RND transporter periplasmic adaptor subunit [Flavobacteriales bacterium]
MQKNKTLIIILILVAVLAFIKIQFLSNDLAAPAMPTPGKPQKAKVTGLVLKEELVDNKIFVTGSVLSNEEVNLMPEISGKVASIRFKEGSTVNKDELLVKINDADLQAQLKKLCLQEKLASEKEARQKKLIDINGISKEEYDATLTQLNSVKADIEVLQAQIAKTEIYAPFTGTIGIRKISEGAYVTPSTLIATMQQINPLKIDFSLPEKYSSTVQVNDQLEFTIDGNLTKYKATVSAIEPKVDINTRTLQVRAITNNEKGNIFPGSFANIELVFSKNEKSILIPTQTLIPILKGAKVFISKNGIAEERKVITGVRSSDKIQIIDGLKAGDTLITSGLMMLKAGSILKFISVK